MQDIFKLQSLLQSKEIMDDSSFIFDDRTIEDCLEFFYTYVDNIPYDAAVSWKSVFSSNNVEVSLLVSLYLKLKESDKSLPSLQAFLLTVFHLLETPKALLNSLPALHKKLYYELLGVVPKAPEADHVLLKFDLKEKVNDLLLLPETLFDAGQDNNGTKLHYALDDRILLNRGKISNVYSTYPSLGDPVILVKKVITDDQMDISIASDGIRLFEESAENEIVMTGRIVASPILTMSEGERSITVTFAEDIAGSDIASAQISNDDHWIDLNFDRESTKSKTVIFSLTVEDEPVTAGKNLDGFESAYPLIKMARRDGQDIPEITQISGSVKGVSNVRLYSDEGNIGELGTGYPFGMEPVLGTGFSLISADWHNKDVTVTLEPEWLNLPSEGFVDWYKEYDETPIKDNNNFKINVSLVSNGESALISVASGLSLFSDGTGKLQTKPIVFNLKNETISFKEDGDELSNYSKWINIDLAGQDFLHRAYWQQSLTTPKLNQPYTPQLKCLIISWTMKGVPLEQYTLSPFGYYSATETVEENKVPALYLGIENLTLGQKLQLYWHLKGFQSNKIQWAYLTEENKWQTLDTSINDTTQGLSESGQWSVTLPKDAAYHRPLMPFGRYWIRGLFNNTTQQKNVDDASSHPVLYGVYANTMTATLINADLVDSVHFEEGLAVGTIKQPVIPIDELAEIYQPHSSFGGRSTESEKAFMQRIALRLSHRQRAVTWQDMRHLLLTQFPEILHVYTPSAVENIAALETPNSFSTENKQVLLVVPRVRYRDNQDVLRPAFNQAQLYKMQTYLQNLASPWADIVVASPIYERVIIDYQVTFAPDIHEGYGYTQLKAGLIQYFMPWSDEEANQEISLANKYEYYAIVAWIQKQTYVASIQQLTLNGQQESVTGGKNQVLVLAWQDEQSSLKNEGVKDFL